MMSLLQLGYVIALRRIIANWRLELVLFLGMLLAVALLSSGVVFSDLLAEAALRRALEQATPEQANFSVRIYSGQNSPSTTAAQVSAYRTSLDFIQQRVAAPFQPYLQGQAHLLETATFFFQGHPQLELANNIRPRGQIKYMSGLRPDRIGLVQGRWPYQSSAGANPPRPPLLREGEGGFPLEVAIDTLGAELLQLGVGHEMEVFPATSGATPPAMRVQVVGVFQRIDPEDEFWYGAKGAFSFKNDQWTLVPLFTTQDAVLEQVLRVYPGLYTDVTWFFYLDRSAPRARDAGPIQDTIRVVERDVHTNLANSSTAIELDKVLSDYQEQLLLARIPLFLMLFLVTSILIYYLALLAGLVVRSRVTEIAMLKSRGSTAFQVGLLMLVEGLLLAVPAVVLGPFLALGLTRALQSFFFDGSGGAQPVPVVFSSQAFLLGAGGAVLAIVVLTISTLVAARQGIVEFRQAGARPPRAPFIHRYYLDILVLALLGLVWWQIHSRGSFLLRPLGSQGLEIDFTLLLGPVLGLLALALLVMRLFPLLLALSARLVEAVGPAWLVQGLRRVSRDPIVPGSLVVLLMLATALGVIGSTFSSTLERSQRDRALYAAGADLRIQHNGDRTPIPLLGLSDVVGEVGAQHAVPLRAAEVQRTSGSLLTRGFSASSVSILAVDTENFASVAWYRSDFAGGKSLPALTRSLTPDPSFPLPLDDGIRLPLEATALALWVHPGRPDSRLSLQARLQDARGYYFDVPLGELNFKGWQRLEANLSPSSPPGRGPRDRSPLPPLTPPFTLLSLQVASRSGVTEPGALFLEELVAITPHRGEILADFQTLEGWNIVEDYYKPGLYALDSSESVTRSAVPLSSSPLVENVPSPSSLTGEGRSSSPSTALRTGSAKDRDGGEIPPKSEPGRLSAAFSWAPGGAGFRGLRAGRPEKPIPAVVSPSFLELAGARVGDTLTVGSSAFALPLKVVAEADYFPTLEPKKEPFAVVDLKTFMHYANLHSQRTVGGPNELWVRFAGPDPDPAPIVAALDTRGIAVGKTHLAAVMVSQRVERPLINAAWGGLLVLMFLTLVLASASGVMLFSYIDTRERQTEFALLRTLGSSTKQLNGVIWFNLFVIVAGGIGLGTWAGLQIGANLLPVLEVAEEGVRVTPPMVLQTNWLTLLLSYLALAAVTAATVLWLAWFIAKLEVQQVLRIGEA